VNNLDAKIRQAEAKWMGPISDYLHSLFSNVHLPSHDMSHHQRVWTYCKELLGEIHTESTMLQFTEEQVLVACMFHDTGLVVDASERHGHQSKVFCQQFLTNNPLLCMSGIDEVLYTIHHHDDKSLKPQSSFTNVDGITLLDVVSTADDLDAFGLVGVIRYLEIYALRGMSFDEIPKRIIPNLQNRFENFRFKFSAFPNLVEKHQERFLLTSDFFQSILNSDVDNPLTVSEHVFIAQHLIDALVNNKLDVKSTIAVGLMLGHSAAQVDFYMGLKDELGL
jgi:hypothetical protein